MPNELVNFGGSYEAEMARILRQQRMAETLRQQSEQDIPVNYGGGAPAPISWGSVLAKGLNAFNANRKESEAEEGLKKAAEADRERANALIRSLTGKDNMQLQERPIAPLQVPIPGPDGTPGGQITMPGTNGPGGVAPTPPSQQQMLAMLLAAGDGPQTQAIRNAMLPRVFAEQDYQRQRGDIKADRAETRGYQISDEARERQQQLEDQATTFQNQKGLAQFQNQLPITPYQQQSLGLQREQIKASAAGRNAPPTGYRWGQDGNLQIIPGGPADTTGMRGKATDTQRVTALYADRAKEANRILSSPGVESAISSVGEMAKASIPGFGNFLVSEDYQKAEQSQRDFINAVLRKESGAVIGADEFENARLQYFPQPGDSDAVKAQKRANRETAINGLRRAAGTAIDERPQSMAASNTATSAPQVGTVQGGYRFKGGDPGSPQSWEKVQ